MQRFDYIVIGSGIAGLIYAHKVAEHGTVAIITKKGRADSNTNYAQGGIACVMSSEDSYDLHVRDTLEAGAGLCKEAVVRQIVQEGPSSIVADCADNVPSHFQELGCHGVAEAA